MITAPGANRQRLEKLAAMLRETGVTEADAKHEERSQRPHFKISWIQKRLNWKAKRRIREAQA